MQVLDIIGGTIVDGPGLRTSIYFAGCNHRCPGCHNPQSWDPHAGNPMTPARIFDIVEENGFNVTFTGGDPLMQINDGLIELSRLIKATGKTIWCYTGYTIEEIRNDPALQPILEVVDVIVDGPFIESLRDITLPFRGSSNQRIIKL